MELTHFLKTVPFSHCSSLCVGEAIHCFPRINAVVSMVLGM